MPLRLPRPSTNIVATLACLAIFIAMYALVFCAAFYQSRQLKRRFRTGPWAVGLVTKVWISGSPGRYNRGVYYYEATVEFLNVVDGKPRACSGTANIGPSGSIKPGDKLRIAPLKGTCGDIATAFD